MKIQLVHLSMADKKATAQLELTLGDFNPIYEDKLQTYNKINGAIRRHFGKQMKN